MVKSLSRTFMLLMVLPLASVAATFEEGKHYVKLDDPVPTADSSKIEVAEVFWYGCGHCYKLEAGLKPWVANLPKDVEFVKMPAPFGGTWNQHAKLYYTIESFKLDDKVHDAVFNAIHVSNNRLGSPEKMAKLLAKYGVDEKAFKDKFKSFGVVSQLQQASSKVKGYWATKLKGETPGVPAIIINGKYRTGASLAGGEKKMFEVAEYLVEQERKLKVPASQQTKAAPMQTSKESTQENNAEPEAAKP